MRTYLCKKWANTHPRSLPKSSDTRISLLLQPSIAVSEYCIQTLARAQNSRSTRSQDWTSFKVKTPASSSTFRAAVAADLPEPFPYVPFADILIHTVFCWVHAVKPSLQKLSILPATILSTQSPSPAVFAGRPYALGYLCIATVVEHSSAIPLRNFETHS